MKNVIAALVLGVVGLVIPAMAQTSQLPLPSPRGKGAGCKGLECNRGDTGKEHAGVCREIYERQGSG